jgi:hypothetical protein
MELPDHSLDVAFSILDVTAHYWDERVGAPLVFTVDESKYFAESKWIWDRLTRSDTPDATFHGSGNTLIRYPMKVEATRTANSKHVRQLQFADIVAGAMAEFSASRIDTQLRSDYTGALVDAGLVNLAIGGIWPSIDVTPDEMGTLGISGEYLNFVESRLKRP